MALTTEQEEKVAQIIEAFENGKRLSDLPNVSGTNPITSFVRFLTKTARARKQPSQLFSLTQKNRVPTAFSLTRLFQHRLAPVSVLLTCTKAALFRTVCVAVCLTMMATWLNTLTLAIGRVRCVTVHEVRSWWRFLFTIASLRLTAQN